MKRTDHFLSCDWGTSSFRLRLVARDGGRVVGSVENGRGVKGLHTALVESGQATHAEARSRAFAAVLAEAIGELAVPAGREVESAPVVISGMASSTVGWRELPYARTPCRIDGSSLRVESVESVEAAGSRHTVWMISGLSTGMDMMRGEESELLGVLAMEGGDAARDGALVVLPGTHSKHVRVAGGEVTDFRTFLTGELFELLATRSLLGASLAWPPGPLDERAFREGLDWAGEAGLDRGLFRVRSRAVLDGVVPASNTWFFAGLLIGSEVRELLAWEGAESCPILLAATAKFATTYRIALEQAGAAGRCRVVPPDDLLRATLRIHRSVLDRLEA